MDTVMQLVLLFFGALPCLAMIVDSDIVLDVYKKSGVLMAYLTSLVIGVGNFILLCLYTGIFVCALVFVLSLYSYLWGI